MPGSAGRTYGICVDDKQNREG